MPFPVVDRSFSTAEFRLGLGQEITVHFCTDYRFEFALDEGGDSSSHRGVDGRAVSLPGRPEGF
jgi:hypothetical protein